MRAFLIALATLVATTGTTLAAPAFDWTGFYAGVFGGGGAGKSDWTNIYNSAFEDKTGPVVSLMDRGLIGGANVGANFQTGVFVVGGEATLGISSVTATDICFGNWTGIHASCSTSMGPFGTLAAKLGVAAGDTLFYLKGGVAVANFTYTVGDFVGFTDPNYPAQNTIKTGTLIGVGVDHQVAPQTILSGSVEFMNFGSHRQAFSSPTFPSGNGCVDCYNSPFATDILDQVVVAKVGVYHTFN